MGSSTGMKWIFFILIYYVVLSLLFTATGSLESEFGIENEASFSDKTDYCSSPRISLNKDGTEEIVDSYGSYYEDYSGDFIGTRGLRCELVGYDQEKCENINGCNWEASDKIFGLFGSGDERCLGDSINISYYEPNYEELPDYIELEKIDLCSDIADDREECELFGCTWNTESSLEDVKDVNPGGGISEDVNMFNIFLDVIGDVFTLDLNFNVDSDFFNLILNLLFVLLPLIFIIGGIISVIRG